ncbi:hypothetical protein [Roseateles saccharophilus]|uniref:Activator of Hsp90 ATPase-like protein n=1 Tax=Roseateles saccharophilus TaxID=304 RepID=A0A4R3UPV4_ROSSA|nr:hypothetical protein [Roseateles saccharophilus]MDG0833530.1 hypothetical protein [Roseateles saccharophilus]TCU92553.1 hypothetical protein EV671_102267 [Roseateles saccharophilus]
MQRSVANDEGPEAQPAPVFRSLVLPLPRALAFELFTFQIHRWWSPVAGASPTGVPWGEIVLQTWQNGRWFERDREGVEHEWGRVASISVPVNIIIDWYLNKRFRDVATELELCFIEIDEGRTRLTLEHRAFERLGPEGVAVREAICQGWNGLMSRYAIFCRNAAALLARASRAD